jgi:hypothetical protein
MYRSVSPINRRLSETNLSLFSVAEFTIFWRKESSFSKGFDEKVATADIELKVINAPKNAEANFEKNLYFIIS